MRDGRLDVLSLGAGVQSTTVLLMSCLGELPKLDAAVFADTQWEPKAVYKHLAWLETEAKGYGIPVHRVTAGDLRADAIRFRRTGGKASGDPGYKRWASMPLYILNPDGSIGKVNRQCTKEYKINPIERFIKRQLLGVAPKKVAPARSVNHWFGISADEVYRMRVSPNRWQVNYYPLIETAVCLKNDELFVRGFDRQDCLDWMQAHGFPEPPRSACSGCPFHSDAEWIRMRDTDPESWADAVAFDREIRAADAALQADGMHKALAGRLVGLPFLHRTCVPLDQVAFKGDDKAANIIFGMRQDCTGMCGV